MSKETPSAEDRRSAAESATSPDTAADTTQHLPGLRQRIDRIDAAMVYLIAERFSCTEEIGRIKRDAHLPAFDGDREAQQKERLAGIADEAGISREIVVEVFETVTAIVKRRHRELGASDLARTPAPEEA
ncbi:MAG: chorismate mutase [Alkalispirochaeta sp.]